jgi:hypothetical protein
MDCPPPPFSGKASPVFHGEQHSIQIEKTYETYKERKKDIHDNNNEWYSNNNNNSY